MNLPLLYSMPLRCHTSFDYLERSRTFSRMRKDRKGSTPYANRRNRKRKNRTKRK
jgi:hypothetical protein